MKTVFSEAPETGAGEELQESTGEVRELTWEIYCKEVRPMWLLCTKGYGFTVKDIDSSCPADLEPYAEAYKLEMKQRDREMWMWWGEYGLAATSVAVDHCLNGRKAQSKYIDKPIIERADIANNEKEIQKQRKAFLAGLMAMQANFELSHPKRRNKHEFNRN